MLGIHDPWLSEEESKRLSSALSSGWISGHGSNVGQLEATAAAFLKTKDVVTAVNTGSGALLLALRSLRLQPGFRALVSDYGFVATANAVKFAGGEVTFIGPDSLENPSVDAERVAQAMDRHGPFHVVLYNQPFGFATDMERLREAVDVRGACLVEDASQAWGVRQKGKYLGTFSHAGCWSLNGNKTFTSGQGGILRLEKGSEIARELRHQGRCDSFDFFYSEGGYNFQLSNLLAAIGVAQFERAEEILDRKKAIHEEYVRLAAVRGLRLLRIKDAPMWLNVVVLDAARSREEMRQLAARCLDLGFQIRPTFPPVSANEPYRGSKVIDGDFSQDLFGRGICIPSGAQLTRESLEKVIDGLARIL